MSINGRDIRGELAAYRVSSTPLQVEIKVPKEICEEEKATIVGYESGEGNTRARAKSKTWLYYLRFPNESQWFIASEEEIIKWQE